MNSSQPTPSVPPAGGQLAQRHCAPCEGGAPRLEAASVRQFLGQVPDWELSAEEQRIRRSWRAKDFSAALEFFDRIGQVAEQQGHHPDLHLVGYRQVTVEIWTHAVEGLTENDFILAAHIDQLPPPA